MDRARGMTTGGEGQHKKALSPFGDGCITEPLGLGNVPRDCLQGAMWAFLVTATETAVQLQKLMRVCLW